MENKLFTIETEHVVYLNFDDDDEAVLIKQWIGQPEIISQFEVFKIKKENRKISDIWQNTNLLDGVKE